MKKPRLLVVDSERDEVDIKMFVKKGVYVLVANSVQHFWVHVCDILKNRVLGIVCSHTKHNNTKLNFGDVIQFSFQNIIDVFTLVEGQTDASIQRNHQALVDV